MSPWVIGKGYREDKVTLFYELSELVDTLNGLNFAVINLRDHSQDEKMMHDHLRSRFFKSNPNARLNYLAFTSGRGVRSQYLIVYEKQMVTPESGMKSVNTLDLWSLLETSLAKTNLNATVFLDSGLCFEENGKITLSAFPPESEPEIYGVDNTDDLPRQVIATSAGFEVKPFTKE